MSAFHPNLPASARPIADVASEATGVQTSRMISIARLLVAAALMLPSVASRSQAPSTMPPIGEEYEITKSYETAEEGSDGSSSTSQGSDTILERLIAIRDGGIELEYDLPKESTAQDRASTWQFPVRVFSTPSGSTVLLNHAELETRVDGWLKAAGWSREVCGRLIFTWNAFRIECDPQSVIKALEAYDLGSTPLSKGATYRDPFALQPGTLALTSDGPNGDTYEARMAVDPEAVRRSRAEVDVMVGEIMQKPVTLDAALLERTKEAISGSIIVTIDTDAVGRAWRRIKVTKLETRKPNGVMETSTATETLTRRLVSERTP